MFLNFKYLMQKKKLSPEIMEEEKKKDFENRNVEVSNAKTFPS